MDDAIDTRQLVGLMPLVRGYHETLQSLGEWWQKVTLIGKINSLEIAATLLEDMEETKSRFETLQGRLIENLVQENLRKLELELGARAQVAIDILIRNLFERTADVGFLATDDDLRDFLREPEADAERRRAIVERLHEYTLKYSVYDEIVVLDPSGRVRVHLDEANNPITHSQDRLIRETLESAAPYLETFRHTDLQPGRRRSLIYSAPITESNDRQSPVLGVLCLCFRFDNEMQGIFANLAKGAELIAILDESGRVIASSNEQALAFGGEVARVSGDGVRVVSHAQQDYMAKTAATHGYQDFYGLSWQGHVMMPVKHAFGGRNDGGEQLAERARLSHSALFSDELRSISRTAAAVTDDLILVVLNGQIISAKRDAREFMPVLDEIRNIGRQTKGVFDESIANLYGTVVASLMSDVQFQASLAVDIMDRNLYERANDVRWWALTTRFRELLAAPVRPEARETLSAILAYINGLYTVYTNLFLFSTQGEILAVSNPAEAGRVGERLPLDGVYKAALGVRESQKYVVSPFVASELYGGRHTYVYATSVRALEDEERVLGGIGIVFDSEPQFAAMLEDALPRDNAGAVIPGAFGVFADCARRVIAATDPALPAGSELTLDDAFFELANGERMSALVTFREAHYAVGAAMSQGYREYKTSGDYENDVVGLIFVPV